MSSRVIFRVDSSFKIATGHVMRCITLAKALKKKSSQVEVVFICRDLAGNIIERVKREGFSVEILPKPQSDILPSKENQYLQWLEVDLLEDFAQTKEVLQKYSQNSTLVIDHYAINETWEGKARDFVEKIVVIDDLANRVHDCDILIDQNFYHNYQDRYNDLVPKRCQKLLGPEYAILRDQFFQIKPRNRVKIENILVFFGGTDPQNVTLKAINGILKAQKDLGFDFEVTVIGAKNDYQEEIKAVCQENNLKYKSYVENMAQIMNWADISIGAGGTTSWERCHMNLPAIVVSLADNQIEICNALDSEGVIKYLGSSEKVSEGDISSHLINIFHNFHFKTLNLSLNINKMVFNVLMDKIKFKEMSLEDIEIVRICRNSEHVKSFMIGDGIVSAEEQRVWFNKVRDDDTSKYLLVLSGKAPIGLVNFTNIDNISKSSDWGFYIGDRDYLSKGLGCEILKLAISYARDELGLACVKASIVSSNVKSIGLHRKMGFDRSDVLKNKVKKFDKLHDLIIMKLNLVED